MSLAINAGIEHYNSNELVDIEDARTMTSCAHARVASARAMRRSTDPSLTFPGIRAIVQNFTALLLAQQPNYFKRIQELQQINYDRKLELNT